jgi:hypothetical protein
MPAKKKAAVKKTTAARPKTRKRDVDAGVKSD